MESAEVESYNIGFVILTWNSQEDIKNCIDSVLALGNEYCGEIVVVDNGSTDNTLNILKLYDSQIKIILLDKNCGTTYSRNLGMKKLSDKCKYICILDSDTIVNVFAFQYMLEYLNLHSECGIIGPKMKSQTGEYQMSGRNIPTAWIKLCKGMPVKKIQKYAEKLEQVCCEEDNCDVGYLMSACWLIPAYLPNRIGYLDEKIFYAPEDVEYCIRASLEGYTIVLCTNAEILHKWQRISKKKLFSKMNILHLKGLLYLFIKYRFFFSAKRLNRKIFKAKQKFIE